jgi:hypothetical protein
MTWQALTTGAEAAVERWQALEVQLLFEVVVVLAFGRTIVVPQPYAFDSLPFLAVARETLAARNAASNLADPDRPFRLSLFDARGFDAVLGTLVNRIGSADKPFTSSLFPELHTLKRAKLEAVANDLDTLINHVSPEDDFGVGRLRALGMIRREFADPGETGIRGVPNGAAPFNRILRRLRDGPPPPDLSDSERGVFAELRPGVAAWLSRAPEADQRSWLHNEMWPGKKRLTPARVVGGEDRLRELREFADTAYNCLLARSASVGIGSFTTEPLETESDDRLRRRADAQRLALRLFSEAFGGALRDRPHAQSGAPERFGLVLRPGAVRAERRQTLDELRAQLVGALHTVMEARASGPDSKFWSSVRRLNAEFAKDPANAAVEKAVNAHVDDHVRRLMSGRVEVAERPGLASLLSISSGTGATYISTAAALPVAAATAVSAAAAVTAEAFVLRNVIKSHSAAWRGRRRWRRVLTEAVSFTRLDGQE